MNSMDEFPTQIRYEYTVDNGSNLNVAHGVWGGINPQGEIEMNFYLESDKLPSYSERSVEKDGTMGMEKSVYEDNGEHVIIRRIHSRILLNYHTARSLVEWLEEKIESLELEDGETYSGNNGLIEVQQ
ncbi:MAG: hypothetical protein J6I40_03850 [Mailhella sp.]|nr:hypothetical protein [Mailhella sp.]